MTTKPPTNASPRRGRTPTRKDALGGQVQSLTRGLALLEKLGAVEGGLTLTDLAAQCGLAPSTTHRLLTTLETMGFVNQDAEIGHWTVGLKAFQVGTAFLANRDFVGQSHPYLRKLMETSGETANLAILDNQTGLGPVFIDQVQCHEIMRTVVKTGGRVPPHASGVGKAILAALGTEERRRILTQHGILRYTPKTITSMSALDNYFSQVRKQGFSYDDEEQALGLRCVAAAIYDEHAEPLGAISISGPTFRLTDDRIKSLATVVSGFAEEITAKLGGRWPHPY